MNNKYNINDSIFSMEYKIPYEKSIIEEHLEESQEEINFIKIKLTEAYEKLEQEIKQATDLEEENQILRKTVDQLHEKYLYEKKQNGKLKQTLEIILKNRKILQEQNEELKNNNKKGTEKDKYIEQLQKEIKNVGSKTSNLMFEVEQKSRIIKDYEQRWKQQSMQRSYDSKKQQAMANKIHILQQEIARITEEKYVEVNRLRHQLQLYQRSVSPFSRDSKVQQKKDERKRQFSKYMDKKIQPKYDTRNSIQSELQFMNKENNSLQMNPMQNSSLIDSNISKWKKSNKQMNRQSKEQILIVPASSTSNISGQDQQLTTFQMARKKAEYELSTLQKIKRPSQEQRDKIYRLQREIYHLDSDIAGLKRKIRRKY